MKVVEFLLSLFFLGLAEGKTSVMRSKVPSYRGRLFPRRIKDELSLWIGNNFLALIKGSGDIFLPEGILSPLLREMPPRDRLQRTLERVKEVLLFGGVTCFLCVVFAHCLKLRKRNALFPRGWHIYNWFRFLFFSTSVKRLTLLAICNREFS